MIYSDIERLLIIYYITLVCKIVMKSFKPTYLYIKQHILTGKLYFGKTISNPDKYLGSGTVWKRHIQKHGKEFVVTLWSELFVDKNELIVFAQYFSESLNIVKSTSWLNLKPENGIDGGDCVSHLSPEEYNNWLTKHKNHRHSEETRKKMSASSNHLPNPISQFKSKEWQKQNAAKQVTDGVHNMLGGEIQRKLLAEGRHQSQKQHTCPKCHKVGFGVSMLRWHFDNCRVN